ncbi:MAG: YgjV family protein [Bacteroidales bacterium]|nr:YgjV family protein [Bacteroidales bacterium]
MHSSLQILRIMRVINNCSLFYTNIQVFLSLCIKIYTCMDYSVFLEWVGYLASVIIAVSMFMNSLVKFRVINLVGAALFSVYGFLIGSIPVGLMNGIIVVVDIYYLLDYFRKKEVFEVIEVDKGGSFLQKFLTFYRSDILKIFHVFDDTFSRCDVNFFVLRNMTVAGLFMATDIDNGVLRVELDYAIPEMRDFKSGKFMYTNLKPRFVEMGYTKLVAKKADHRHNKYLKSVGFSDADDEMMVYSLV